MPTRSAGILLWRREADRLAVLLALPGGPYTRGDGDGEWQIPKGGVEPGESARAAAMREFAEETGFAIGTEPVPLGTIRQKGGKLVEAFAVEGEFELAALVSNEFELEWPPRSGTTRRFPEIARVEWFAIGEARDKMLPSQTPLLEMLVELVGATA